MEPAFVLRIALCVSVLVQTGLGSTSETDSVSTTPPGGCVLPQQPEFSKYTEPVCDAVSNKSIVCQGVAGSIVPQNWLLNFTCDEGYYFDEGGPNVYVFCAEGSWTPSIPVCRRWCKPLNPLNVDVRCEHKGKEIDCSKAVPFGTEATGHCRMGYEPTGRAASGLSVCKDDGQWSHHDLVRCVPDCGRKDPDLPLIMPGSVVSESPLPWFVGIYGMNEENKLEHRCGGTLISSHVVLTAGHCVYSEVNSQVVSPQKIKVALGKRFRNWAHDEPGAVKSEVREIAVSPLYFGRRTNYAYDIALLDLKTNVPFNSYIRPACVDWEREIEVTSGQLGTLTGWGLRENGTIDETLVPVQLPYENTKQCISKAPVISQQLITPDKFCSIIDEGRRVTAGYAGGGLTFDSDGRHYVQGVLSTKATAGHPTFVTFTSLKNVLALNWLQETKRNFGEANQDL